MQSALLFPKNSGGLDPGQNAGVLSPLESWTDFYVFFTKMGRITAGTWRNARIGYFMNGSGRIHDDSVQLSFLSWHQQISMLYTAEWSEFNARIPPDKKGF